MKEISIVAASEQARYNRMLGVAELKIGQADSKVGQPLCIRICQI